MVDQFGQVLGRSQRGQTHQAHFEGQQRGVAVGQFDLGFHEQGDEPLQVLQRRISGESFDFVQFVTDHVQ